MRDSRIIQERATAEFSSLNVIFRTFAPFSVPAQRSSAAFASTSTSATSPSSPSSSSLGLFLRGWSDECKVNADGLVEELCVVQGLDGSFCLWLGWIFDQGIPLFDSSGQQEYAWGREVGTNLDVASSPIKIQMDILNVSIFGKQICQVLFGGFFVYISRNDDPALDTADSNSIG